MTVWYEPRAAVDPTTNASVNNVNVQLYANSDTNFTTPLTVTDASGVPTQTLRVSGYILPGFYGPDEGCVARASGYLTPLQSLQGLREAAETSANAAITALSSAMQSIKPGPGLKIDNSDPKNPAVSIDIQGDTVATNLMPVPYWTGDASAWSAAQINVSIGPGEVRNGHTAVQATSTSGNTAGYVQVRNSIKSYPNVPAGKAFWFVAWVNLSPESNGQVFTYLRDDPNNVTAAVDFITPQTITGVPTGSWQMVAWKATVHAGNTVTGLYMRTYSTAAAAPVGMSIQADDWFVILDDTASVTPPVPFTGDSDASNGLGYRWTGPQGASTSEQFRPTLAGLDLSGIAAGGGGGITDLTDYSQISGLANYPTAFTPAAHTHTITDVTSLQASLDQKAPLGHTHTAAQITDATSVGRQIMQAADAASARSIIGAGTGSGGGDWSTLTGKPAVIAAGATPAEARQVIGAGTSSVVIGTASGQALDATGTAAAAAKLATPRTINGKTFDGTQNVVIGAGDISSGNFGLAQLPPGTAFEIETTDGTNWTYNGATITARPTARTDLRMECVNPVNGNVPTFAISKDRLLRV